MLSDLATVLVSVIASGGVAYAILKWLSQRIVEHQFKKNLESHKANLAMELEQFKVELNQQSEQAKLKLEASLKLATDSTLSEEAAERSYRYDALKRLYTVIGPLRFQLLVASSEYVSRVETVGLYGYSTSLTRYFGQSLLYRIARLLALAELIERQIAYADFSVDSTTMDLLRFRSQLQIALSSSDISLGHPNENWDQQVEHIFRDTLPSIATSMLCQDEGQNDTVLKFEAFAERLETEGVDFLKPLSKIINSFDLTSTPIFWLRMLAIAKVCEDLVKDEKISKILETPKLDYQQLLAKSRDKHIKDHKENYLEMLARTHKDITAH